MDAISQEGPESSILKLAQTSTYRLKDELIRFYWSRSHQCIFSEVPVARSLHLTPSGILTCECAGVAISFFGIISLLQHKQLMFCSSLNAPQLDWRILTQPIGCSMTSKDKIQVADSWRGWVLYDSGCVRELFVTCLNCTSRFQLVTGYFRHPLPYHNSQLRLLSFVLMNK